MAARGAGRGVVAALGVTCLLLAGCTADEQPSPSSGPTDSERSTGSGGADTSEASSPTGDPDLVVRDVGFDVPTGWERLDVGRAGASTRRVADQLGLTPQQLARQQRAGVMYLVPEEPGADYLPTINAYHVPGELPTDDEVEQDFARIGAEVTGLSREDTAVGEVIVVTHRLPLPDTTVEGTTVVVPDGDRVLLIAVSEVDRARADEVADTVVTSLVGD